MITLYTYWRSSAAYRARIALNLKGVPHDLVPVHLVKGGADGGPAHRDPAYRAINPQMRIPALKTEGGLVLPQSLALIEWLEERFPDPALLPRDPERRALVRAVALMIAADIHPLNNSSTLAMLRRDFNATDAQVTAWMTHWMVEGLTAVEALIEPGPFAFGAAPTLADICIVPVFYSAKRFGIPLDGFPKLAGVDAAMLSLDAVRRAAPAAQADAE